MPDENSYLVRYPLHGGDVAVISFHPLLVLGNVFGVQKLAGGRVLAETVLRDGASVHEGLSRDRETSVHDGRLVHVEHKLGILYDVHPKPERKRWRDR